MRLSRSTFVAAALVALASTSSFAATVVAPNNLATTGGDGQDNDTRFFGRAGDTDGQRFQQIYDAGQFSALGSTERITSLALRPKTGGFFFPGIFGGTITVSNITISLSTTQKNSSIDGPNNISGQFADNLGTDTVVVYSGPLTVQATVAGDPTNFGYVVTFQNGFNYTRGLGNLLLDVTIPAGATTTESGSNGYSRPDTQTGEALGANANDGIASAFGATDTGTIGANTTTGFITQFTTQAVPEPTSLALLGLGATAMLRRRR